MRVRVGLCTDRSVGYCSVPAPCRRAGLPGPHFLLPSAAASGGGAGAGKRVLQPERAGAQRAIPLGAHPPHRSPCLVWRQVGCLCACWPGCRAPTRARGLNGSAPPQRLRYVCSAALQGVAAPLGAEGPGWSISSSMFAHPTTNSINIVRAPAGRAAAQPGVHLLVFPCRSRAKLHDSSCWPSCTPLAWRPTQRRCCSALPRLAGGQGHRRLRVRGKHVQLCAGGERGTGGAPQHPPCRRAVATSARVCMPCGVRRWLSPRPLTARAPCCPAASARCLQLSAVVFERERGLRQALKTMGMLESGAA